MKKPDNNDARDLILEYLKRQLIGPFGSPEEVIELDAPHRRYSMGVLFPREAEVEEMLADEEDMEEGGSDIMDDPVRLSGQLIPSSFGLSFYFIGQPSVEVQVYGALYDEIKGIKASSWVRRPAAEEDEPEVVILTSENRERKTSCEVLNGRAKVVVQWRELGQGYLVTVSLVNNKSRKRNQMSSGDCLFQTGFRCRPVNGMIAEYPYVSAYKSDEEETELALLYRNRKVFSVGHGCSADWTKKGDHVDYVRTEFMPKAFVPAMTHDMPGNAEILRISRIADPDANRTEIIREIGDFVDAYEKWIEGQEQSVEDITEKFLEARDRIVARLRTALARMRAGVEFLGASDEAWKAFGLANLAMLIQMRHSAKDLGGGRHNKERKLPDTIQTGDYLTLDYRWRPFQLAFQLLTVESVFNRESDYRDVVDLIWFPTGGGKTEAYLTIAAFEIFSRRIVFGDRGCGTSVITRYTLRLLASQQFQRTCRLITACEYLRRKMPGLLGSKPISIGFWAGGDTTPNSYKAAGDAFAKMLESRNPLESNRFQIDTCPWCGTGLVPEKECADHNEYGFKATAASFEIHCLHADCIYRDELPIGVVDDQLYESPPSFIISTVDKFARMAWIEGPGGFFGDGLVEPPSLIIQDELHLLSGPLGTTVGIYETAFDCLMSLKGIRPKVIASTATIRSAGKQVTNLFGRSVHLFPPSGLQFDDSYFARVDQTKPGRMYVGVMSSVHKPSTSTVRTAAALLQSVSEVGGLSREAINAYWTMVMYHSSLKELGKSVSFARDDIPARMKIIANAEDTLRDIGIGNIIELTSNLHAGEIPEALKRLETDFDQTGAVDIVACTNMFSVGVDVQRLGLMLVVGQPKTTSEYIQASSRVGRGSMPGMVITHYSSTKPRDRSHYETFSSYHSSLYRYVEPTSVTPFSLPSRNRALHAALVILVRHGVGLSADVDAGRFNAEDPAIRRALEMLSEAARMKDPTEAESTRRHLERLVQEWQDKIKYNSSLLHYYSNGGRQIPKLLKNFGDDEDGWPTLHSMRSVDALCEIGVWGEIMNKD